MNAPRKPRTGVIAQAVASYAAIAACVTAALYLAGITTLWVRLRNAGLSAPDVLPHFSLDELLRHGLTWISPAVPALLILAVLLVASVFFESLLDRRAETFQEAWARQIETPDERDQWVEKFRELRTRTDWNGIRSELRTAIPHAPSEAERKSWKAFTRWLTLFAGWTVLIVFLLMLVAPLWLPPILAILTVGGVVVAGVMVGTRPALAALLPLFAVVALAFMANAIVNPRPLPLVTVITADAPKTHKGDFVLSTDAAWYLGQRHGQVLVISADDVKCSRVTSRPRQNPVWRYLLDKKASEPKPGKLKCGTAPRRRDVKIQHAIVVPARGKPVCGELTLGPGGEVRLRGMPKVKAIEQFLVVDRCPK